MNKELIEALDALEKEKEISKETLFEAIENSLLTACKNHFGKADNVKVEINRETGDFLCYAEKEVVETRDDVEDDMLQIALEDAKAVAKKAAVGDVLNVEIKSKEFGRIATQNAKNVILQKADIFQLDKNGYMAYDNFYGDKGKGEGLYITNGKATKIKWEKKTENGITHYTLENGDELTMNAGMTYIGLIPSDYWNEVKLQ